MNSRMANIFNLSTEAAQPIMAHNMRIKHQITLLAVAGLLAFAAGCSKEEQTAPAEPMPPKVNTPAAPENTQPAPPPTNAPAATNAAAPASTNMPVPATPPAPSAPPTQ